MTSQTIIRTQHYWDEVTIDEELPGFTLVLDWRRMADQVSGSQDFYPVHHDPDFATEAGHPGIFYNTGFTRAALCRLLTDFAGDDGWLRMLDFQMRRMNHNGDVLQVRARVTGKTEVSAEEGDVEVDVWIENSREGVTTPGKAIVRLARKRHGPDGDRQRC
jgi:acyl dehydratase